MTAIQFDEPWAVRLMTEDGSKETEEVCPLIAVDGERGLVIRQREMFWWPLNRIRVILQPEVEKDVGDVPQYVPAGLGDAVTDDVPSAATEPDPPRAAG